MLPKNNFSDVVLLHVVESAQRQRPSVVRLFLLADVSLCGSCISETDMRRLGLDVVVANHARKLPDEIQMLVVVNPWLALLQH